MLDNCEHVLAGAAGLVTVLLAQCERVRFLATSRERLDVSGSAHVRCTRQPGWAALTPRDRESDVKIARREVAFVPAECRDARSPVSRRLDLPMFAHPRSERNSMVRSARAVSYTHLTLPTKA